MKGLYSIRSVLRTSAAYYQSSSVDILSKSSIPDADLRTQQRILTRLGHIMTYQSAAALRPMHAAYVKRRGERVFMCELRGGRLFYGGSCG